MTPGRISRRRNVIVTGALVMALVVVVVAAGAFHAPPAAARNGRLSPPHTYTVGDDIALRMEAVFRMTAGLENPATVCYDRKTQNLVTDIFGGTDDPDGAKREIEGYLAAVKDRVAPYAQKRHGITLNDVDVTFVYFNDTGDEPPYEVIRREAGRFVDPARADGD